MAIHVFQLCFLQRHDTTWLKKLNTKNKNDKINFLNYREAFTNLRIPFRHQVQDTVAISRMNLT